MKKQTKNDPQTIIDFRRTNGLSQDGFIKLLKKPVNKTTVCRWERGRVAELMCAEVSEITGVPKKVLRPDLFK